MTKSEIIEAMQEALGNHPCRYTSLTPEQLAHVTGMLTDIGNGDLRRGVEIVRVNHKWLMERIEPDRDEEYRANHELVSAIRAGLGNIGTHIAKGIAWAVILLLSALIWAGFKTKIFQ